MSPEDFFYVGIGAAGTVSYYRIVKPAFLWWRAAPEPEPEPETDANGYIIDPVREAQVDGLEKVCKIGKYAAGVDTSQENCKHEIIEGVCFWCDKTLDSIPAAEWAPAHQEARDAAAALIYHGKAHVVKEILGQMGYPKVSKIPEERLGEFRALLEVCETGWKRP